MVELRAGAGTHTVAVNNGSVAIAPDEQDSVTISAVSAVDSAVFTGPNATVTTCSISGGSALLGKAPTTLNVIEGADTRVRGTAASTTVDLLDGSLIWQGGNITTLNVGAKGDVDMSEDKTNITVTTTNVVTGADQRPGRPNQLAIKMYKCGLNDLNPNLSGRHRP